MQHLKIPREFLFLLEEASGDLFVLECVATNFLFQFVGTDFKTAGISKGLQIPLILGFQ